MTIDQKDMPFEIHQRQPGRKIAVHNNESKLYPSLKMTDI